MAATKVVNSIPVSVRITFASELARARLELASIQKPLVGATVIPGSHYAKARARSLELKQITQDAHERVARLLESDRKEIRELWQLLCKSSFSGDPTFTHADLFLGQAVRWAIGPWGDERRNNKSRTAWIARVEAKAKKLSSEVRDTSLDRFLQDHYAPLAKGYAHVRLSDLLDSLVFRARLLAPLPMTKQGPHQRRAYFVIRLTEYFREHFGKPMRSQVEVVTNLLFSDDDESISIRQIQELTATLPKKTRT